MVEIPFCHTAGPCARNVSDTLWEVEQVSPRYFMSADALRIEELKVLMLC